MSQTDLSLYNNHPYQPGAGWVKRTLWFYINAIIFKSYLLPINQIKIFLLRAFGAKIGTGVVIKPNVNIKYPWHLTVDNNTWIGEGVWIDNLVMVTIGSNVCLSQGAILQTGNHNYKKSSFDLITGSIVLKDGVWVGCGATVSAGVTAGSHSVLTTGSIANKNLNEYFIYQGNPAVAVRKREIAAV
ncbi:colanic acid biosynthesis acetyltransferase WcaF [Mucilaginibacter pallidiroseus]|uniref:Colanic acid biosynthesis acetyltransferase WcaF n=1 Tax=Mucilaginibacter pallidiroseus TaxID=2599295 RepID=A0A563UJF7_9SPHI|nr:WcaF family extracellular polysaccharide biosynthesis acetyltransferase [Mucilaginibacter pallidiroseus]TWR31520.1 colanic acid biosynthesis acetyltransferase WcaF [Mucilaginibacter pallidiroseus]